MKPTVFKKTVFPWSFNGFPDWSIPYRFLNEDFLNHQSHLPALNIKDNVANYELQLAVPGFSKEDISISLENDMLHISGKNSCENNHEEEGYSHQEFSSSSFNRLIKLPKDIDVNQDVEAHYNNGVLKLELHKSSKALDQKARRITIQ